MHLSLLWDGNGEDQAQYMHQVLIKDKNCTSVTHASFRVWLAMKPGKLIMQTKVSA